MRTVKLVVIGNSGVGKTSLRGQYVSGRFSTGYRATIGADFIAKTVPHHSDSEESVTLQIWDTAGQERFSSLSAAFFRGADAAVLMFDVNRPATLHALTRWWSEFRAHAPLPDEDMKDYCLVVVGNKTDLIRSSESAAVPEGTALRFIDELVPPSESRSSTPETPKDDLGWIPGHVPARVASGSDDENGLHENGTPGSDADMDADGVGPADIILVDETRAATAAAAVPDLIPKVDSDVNVNVDGETTPVATIVAPPRTASIDLHALHHKRPSKSRSRSSRFSPAPNGTISSTHTGFTSFHTPASSFSDLGEPYESAPSSPLARSRSPSPSALPNAHRTHRSRSTSTLSTSTAPTITPARYATARTMQRRPPRGPKLFFTSAKTGAGVSDVFAYIAQRVVMRWEWEEAHAEGTDPARNGSTVHLGDHRSAQKKAHRPACCSS
ncbi:ras-domain-containing protein [Lactarius psammicola]|nr:ras-domain-containing protein [Lactarius psammicola]